MKLFAAADEPKSADVGSRGRGVQRGDGRRRGRGRAHVPAGGIVVGEPGQHGLLSALQRRR